MGLREPRKPQDVLRNHGKSMEILGVLERSGVPYRNSESLGFNGGPGRGG